MKPWRWVARWGLLALGAIVLVSVAHGPGGDGVPLSVYLAIVGGLGLAQVLRWPGPLWGIRAEPVPPLATLARRAPEAATPGPLIELEGLLSEAALSGRAAQRRLRPRLERLVSARLLDRHGISVDEEPERAAQLLGPEVWAVVHPEAADVPLTPGEVRRLVDHLEAL